MISKSLRRARNVAATLLTASGIGSIAALWFTDISPPALAGALLGATYLFISIGLYGQSRFALFTAIIIPACALWLNHDQVSTAPTVLHSAQTAIACAVILLSTVVLIAVRNNPRI